MKNAIIQYPRLLVDANVLLNGVFSPLSTSRQLLEEARINGTTIYTHSATFGEAYNVIKRQGVRWRNIYEIFESNTKYYNVVIISSPTRSREENNRMAKGLGDAILADAAIKQDLPICTLDINDFKKTIAHGVKVGEPLEYIPYICSNALQILYGSFGSDEGTLFYTISLNYSPQRAGHESIRLLNFGNDRGIYFNCIECSFQFMIPNSDVFASIKIPSADIEKEKIKLGYTFKGRKFHYFVKIGGQQVLHSEKMYKSACSQPFQLSINGDDIHGAHIQPLFLHPSFTRPKLMKNIFTQRATGSFWDRLPLKQLLNLFFTDNYQKFIITTLPPPP